MDSIPSPCTGVCTLNAENVCVGCGRRLDEIAEWSRAFESRRQRIVEVAAARLVEMRGQAASPASGTGLGPKTS